MFAWHGDLEMRVQKALNNEQYDIAQVLRSNLEGVVTALRKASDARRERGGAATTTAEAEADLTNQQARALVLRNQLASAVSDERYADAAKLRDQLAEAEAAAAASAAALQAARGSVLRFALGQRVVHSVHRWTGVVAGADRCFADTEAFARATCVDALPRGRQQPFYVVLPDANDVSYDARGACVMYVAEDKLRLPPALAQGDECPPPVVHPLAYSLFLGPDARGGFIPTRELRERCGQPRIDVWPPGEEPDV